MLFIFLNFVLNLIEVFCNRVTCTGLLDPKLVDYYRVFVLLSKRFSIFYLVRLAIMIPKPFFFLEISQKGGTSSTQQWDIDHLPPLEQKA